MDILFVIHMFPFIFRFFPSESTQSDTTGLGYVREKTKTKYSWLNCLFNNVFFFQKHKDICKDIDRYR